jgi:hypothetical protein
LLALAQEKDFVARTLWRFAAEAEQTDAQFDEAIVASIAEAIERATVSEVEGRAVYPKSDPNLMQLIVVRHEWRTAKSIRWKNFQADTSLAVNAATSALLGTPVIIGATAITPALWAMAVGLAFTVWRTLEKPVRWEDACTLHALGKEANFYEIVSQDVAEGMGKMLVDHYGYKKGLNSNEVADILDRLIAWGAIERVLGGYKVLESVKFWNGPWLSDKPS